MKKSKQKGEQSKAGSIAITVKNAYDILVDLDTAMTEANLPRVGRKVVLPAWYIGMLRKDVRFVDNFNVLQNGIVEGGTVANLQLLVSNNVVTKKIQMRLYLQQLLVQRVVLHLLNKSLKQKHTVRRKTSLTLSKACLFMVWKSLTLVS